MSAPRSPNPVRRLPPPEPVHAHIGHLLRELRVARRLYRLSRAAAGLPGQDAAHRKAVAGAH